MSTFSYNSRHLITGVTHTLSGQPTVTASFAYDSAANRTSMTDALGLTTYSYDQLSRLTSETRGFTGVGNYTISYQYNLANDLSSLTGPSSTTINYTRDSSGRLTSITRPGQTLASAISYRASGAMKHMLYGDNSAMDVTFNARLQPATFTIPGKISKTYYYHDDGALRFSSDALDHRFDRSYAYDHAARLKNALSGAEARGEGTTTNRPYYQTYGHDAFGHMSQRTVKTWWTGDATVSNTYVNNRKVGWTYDADGRPTSIDGFYAYDAAGRNSYLEISGPTLPTATMTYDGDGRQVKTVETWVDENFETLSETKYYVRSTVLGGQVLTELEGSAGLWRTFVYAGPAVLGWIWQAYGSSFMNWQQRDPSGASVRGIGEQELDPLGADAGTFATSVPPTETAIVSYGDSYNPAHPNFSYTVDGIRVPVESFVAFLGVKLHDPLGLLEDWARASSKPIAYRNVGVRWGEKYDVMYDANYNLVSNASIYDPALRGVSFGVEYAIYSDAELDLTLLPQKPPVIFLTVQLLSNDKDPRVLCESKFEPTGFGTDTAALNVETDSGPGALSGDTFTVRANFLLPKYTKLFARSTGDSGSRVILGKDNRYRFPTEKEAPLGSSYAFFDDGDRRGHVDITLKLRDIEATKNSIFVTVAGVYESGELFSGQASLKIIGNNERPKTPCRPR